MSYDFVLLRPLRRHLLLDRLTELKKYPIVGDARGTGVILGVEFVADQATKRPFPPEAGVTRRIVEAMYAEGVMVVPGMSGMIDAVAGDHIQISPPYVFGETHVEQLVSALEWSFKLSCEISE